MKTNMKRGSKHSSLVENAVAKNDTHLLKKLLNEELLDVKHLEGALTRAATDNNVDVVQLLLDHSLPWEETKALWVVFSAAAKAGRDKFMRFAVAIKLCDRSVPSASRH